MATEKRKVEICIISDIHLGTRACHAAELNHYLKSIDPTILIINANLIDNKVAFLQLFCRIYLSSI